MHWVNGTSQGCIDPFDRGLAYGDGLFATMRTGEAGILFFDCHQARLTAGAARLGFEWRLSHELKHQLNAIAEQYPHHCIKLLLTRGVGGRGYVPPLEVKVSEVVSVHPIPSHYTDWQREGISLKTSSVRLGHQPLLAGIKHLNRLEQVLIKSQPLATGFEDWLVLDCHDKVIESSMANIFFVKGNQLSTPSLEYCGVAGVMREQVMQNLLENGMNIECLPIQSKQLADFDSVFITNSVLGVVDVKQIDTFSFTRSPITTLLREQLSLTL
ncbi:aminodeoxychorismate lyase [Shewanella sp. A25]|nr:aminodeoxychorismate lyase [Shewanella shenzhenensis]